MGSDVFVFCSLAFHTGKLFAIWAADKLSLAAVCVGGDEFVAEGAIT